MSAQYNSYSAAGQAAKECSIKNPGIGWYVSWIEDDAFTVSMFEDYDGQEYYMNGNRMIPDEYE